MSWISNWWITWFGSGTTDDRRNPFWRLTEYLSVKVLWAWTILDLRFIYKKTDGKWILADLFLPYKTQQNFWNGFLTIQLYIVVWRYGVCPKLNIVFRPVKKYYLEMSTPGLLFDRGELHVKFALMNWEVEKEKYGCTEPPGWEEGSV
jgi:hypothetical protein